jgi:Tfp pilus assembly protein PilO
VSAKKRKISPAALSVLIGLAGLVVLAGGLFLLVLPQRHEAADLKGQIADTELQITQARQAAAPKLPQPIHVADLFKLVKAMPDNPDMPGILLQLNQTAHDAGIDFDAITPQAPVAGAVPVQVPISLEFTGNFYDLNDFLFRMRNLVSVRDGKLAASGRFFTLDTLDMHEGPDKFPQIQAILIVSAYVYDPEAHSATTIVAPVSGNTLPTGTTTAGGLP